MNVVNGHHLFRDKGTPTAAFKKTSRSDHEKVVFISWILYWLSETDCAKESESLMLLGFRNSSAASTFDARAGYGILILTGISDAIDKYRTYLFF